MFVSSGSGTLWVRQNRQGSKISAKVEVYSFIRTSVPQRHDRNGYSNRKRRYNQIGVFVTLVVKI